MRLDRSEPIGAVTVCAAEHNADDMFPVGCGGRHKQGISRRTGMADLRSSVQSNAVSFDKHVTIGWSNVDVTTFYRLSVFRERRREFALPL